MTDSGYMVAFSVSDALWLDTISKNANCPRQICDSCVGQVSRSDLRDLLLQCCADDALDVRQSALALLGDLVKV